MHQISIRFTLSFFLFLLALAAPAPGVDLQIGPIPGLTTTWHPAPQATAIPVGTTLRLRVAAPVGATVIWSGAVETSHAGGWSEAECPVGTAGPQTVRVDIVRPDGIRQSQSCVLKGMAIRPEEIQVEDIRVTVDPVPLLVRDPNASTYSAFRGGSIAALRPVGPGRYRTSVGRRVRLETLVRPAGFAPLMEWRSPSDGFRASSLLGGAVEVTLGEPGLYPIWAGPPTAAQRIYLEAYSVEITSHTSWVDRVPEGIPITFTARTVPPGFEDEISWLSSTSYGSASPISGGGRTFTVAFRDTFGSHPLTGEAFQWLGVRADNATFSQDVKGRVLHQNVNIRRPCPAGGPEPQNRNADCEGDGQVNDDLVDEMIDTGGNRVRLCCLDKGLYVLQFIPAGGTPRFIGQCSFPWGLNAGWKRSVTGLFTEITWYNMEGLFGGTNVLHDSDGDQREDRYCYIYDVRNDDLTLQCEDRATGPGGVVDPNLPWQPQNSTGQSPAPESLSELNQLLFSIAGTIAPDQHNDPTYSGLRFDGMISGGGMVAVIINDTPSPVTTEPFMTVPHLVERLQQSFTEQWQQGGRQQQQQGKSAFVFEPGTLGIRNALPEEIQVQIIGESGLTVEREILPTPEGEVLSLEFAQIDLNLDGNTQANSTWGSVDLTFIGSGFMRYVNLLVNGVWRVRNIPILDVEGPGIVQTVTLNFGLGNEPGEDVEELSYAFDYTDEVLDSPPQATIVARVGNRAVEIDQGELGETAVPTEGQILEGGPAMVTESAFNFGVPNQEVGADECVPGAISNSLMFLQNRHGLTLPQEATIDAMKPATGWGPGGAPTAPIPWWELKDNFMQANGFPIMTTTTTDFAEAIQALRDDCDVELRAPGHAAVVTGIVPFTNGDFAIEVKHDTLQGQAGGLKTELVLYRAATGTLWDGMWFDQKPFDRFVIECPTM